ncbi:hypothetical protein HMPREF3228_00023 [Streptococcus mitis]|uniref:Uncharacterized protein n=1 Tax=Streptococcus mitis TaxID=28037 RepID=A0A133S3T0_STRMT|nr:hypothetical protein HMPREF3228_00023 [Streptococcus mitis]
MVAQSDLEPMMMEITDFIFNPFSFFDNGLRWWGRKQPLGFIPKL